MIWVAVVITMLLFILVAKPTGIYLEKAFQGSKKLDKVFGPFEKLIFKITGVKEYNQTWKQYALSLVLLNGFMIVVVYFIFRLQGVLPLNPAHIEGMEPTLAFNTAISFMTDTNLQHYSGENGLSYLSQLIGITFLMFAAPATTLALVMAFIRGLAGKELGNFFVDFTRALTRVFLPIAFVTALVFVALGVPQTLDGAVTAQTIDGVKQSIVRGPVASFVSIKELGNNGGGFFGTNSTHPFENPGQMSNILQMMLMMLLPTALPFTYGRMVGNKKQGRILFVSLFMVFLLGFITITTSELNGNPALNAMGIEHVQGSTEGKEVRFGTVFSSLYATVTTAAETGAVNTMHDTLTPIGGLVPLVNMMLNTVYGGVGAGFVNIITYAIIAVFISGLMVGRTPEFLGKKIEGKEMKLIAVTILFHPLLILGFSALALSTSLGTDAISNLGFHGLTQIVYEYTSSAVNNGSGFEGLGDATTFWNITTGLVMFLGRYFSLVTMLAVAASLKEKTVVPETVGTFRTDNGLFGGIFIGTIVIVGALTFFPMLVLGPIAEFLTLK
ncbi:potassium-transporting ATPase subunit KdpA [Bacillus thuringiensis]|uniref:Potassium-transporting ATPase potassium-binding subunit n=1 Tax=Bacillus thuringiensis subsp. konkukian (strain 97-27) TaxID=281309 RepID=KDPA_BACHK|nr:potassium-transporting ATPase subunit KdpA [Bacillus thuringiensis]Q6HN79.1 RecName: Full=Potassium-transporting ATPase potassium-binding subunit; AltName: Full=ATP phosphohydrolase [potassium-transporting] A chain; AltName: Full=Potassium-binding and translocating subunit A; AltName: Full=Potassium-translocating ATPase A chain [[Bacillus thuringiensis] serovar konkukian str. 97-27]AAT62489.1 potassium-transporting ATPase, subunit A [[Bacillus thuringiensis] serovar konkukian str. 97-27]AJI36